MRYLRPRRNEGFISLIALFSFLGIALGVATLIIVMSVMNGFREELLSRILGLNGHVNVQGPVTGLTDYDALLAKIRTLPGVVSAEPMIDNQVMVTSKGVARGAVVRGVRPEDMRARAIIANNIKTGSLDAFQGNDAVMIGDRLAERLGLGVGDRITVISPTGNVTAFGTVPRVRAYRIVATFDVGMFEYDSGFVFMPLEAAQTYFNMPNAVTTIEVFATSADAAPRVARELWHVVDEGAHVLDWQRLNAGFFNAIQVG